MSTARTATVAANPDVLRVDLATGNEARLTFADDYDEPLELSRDGSSYVVGSGRTSGLFATVAQLRRPNFIGPGLAPLVGALFVAHQDALIEPWLVDTGSEERGALGRQLDPDSAADGYDARAIPNWKPDGTRIVFWEASTRSGADREPNRLVLAGLPDRSPVDPVVPDELPSCEWASPLAEFVPPAPPAPSSRPGAVSGSVAITVDPSPTDASTTSITVTYTGFADEKGWVIDGIEFAEYSGGMGGTTRHLADLTVTGEHHGYLRAAATIRASGIDGSIDSEVDGLKLHLPRS